MRPALFRQMAHDALYIPPVVGRREQAVRFVQDEHVEVSDTDERLTSRGKKERGESARGADEDGWVE